MNAGIIILQILVALLGVAMALGSLINLSRSPHWFVRGWDYPRLQIAGVALASFALYTLFFNHMRWYDIGLLVVVGSTVAYQGYRIYPYTFLGRREVKPADRPYDDASLRLLIINVLKENTRYDRLLQVIQEVDPDMVLAVEVNDAWMRHLQPLEEGYQHTVIHPQDNYYGMALFSKLKLIDPQVRTIVEDDVPSIHTTVELRSGDQFAFRGVHPRPPEPVSGEDSIGRDAEMVVLAREIEENGKATIVAGDLNDAAWSRTTKLFRRISHMLDPRIGRGFFNTWDANRWLLRAPIDQVFHSDAFKLLDLRVLPHVGSDHFPILISLSYDPLAPLEQPVPEKEPEHEEEAQEKIDMAEEEQGAPVDSPEREA